MGQFYTIPFLLGLCLQLSLSFSARAQYIPRAEVDSLLLILQAYKPDTNRIRTLLRIGEYHVYKPGEFKIDMDSASTYVMEAQRLSRILKYYSGEAKSLNLLGNICKESKDFSKAIIYQKSAIKLFKQYNDVKGEAVSYILLAQALRDKGDVEQARNEVQKAIDVYAKNGLLQQTGEAYLELGNTFANWGEELNEKIKVYYQALEVFSQVSNKRRQADVLKDLGDLYLIQGSNAQSLIELRKALSIYRSLNYPQLQGVYDLLGYVSSAMSDYQEGLKYGLKAVETAERLKDSTMQMCTIYNRVGMTYYFLKQFQRAHVYYEKSLAIAQKYNHLPSILLLTGNIANLLMHTRQPEEALGLLLNTIKKHPPQDINDSIYITSRLLETYTKLKKYAAAQKYCDQLLVLSDNVGKKNSLQLLIHWNVITFFLASKQHDQTRRYLPKYEAFCKETHNLRETSMAELYWFKLDSMQTNYASAIKHYQLYKQLQDSLFNETKSRQIASLEVLHETERKEKDIQLKEQSIKALTKERQLQEQQIKKDELIRNVIIGGAILLLLLLGVIYNRYRLKRRSNLLLEAQQNVLKAQQQEINEKNTHLSELLTEKDSLIVQKDTLLGEKDSLLEEKDGLLTEKEWLLKEIHHRVKNNLQVVMSLLDSQANSLVDKAALSAIQESQHRVQAMALIHQKLYQSESLARIPMCSYIEEVVSYLNDSYHLHQPIRIDLSIDPIELDVTLAVPLGLIINETITNAFKYAFPNGRSGTITLHMHCLEQGTYQLIIKDDGIGLPVNYDPSRSRSLGMTLIHGFSRQVGGKLSIINDHGLNISLKFGEQNLIPVHSKASYAY